MSEASGQQLPPGWCWTTSGELFDFVTSGSRGWAKYYADSGALFLRMGNLDHHSISLDLADVQRVKVPKGVEGIRTKVEPGDILISITADVGMTGLVPSTLEKAYINQHVALARPVRGICAAYLAWYLASASGGQKQFKALQRGATKVGLGLDDIRSIRVPMAPLAEQEAIVALIDELLSDLDAGVIALGRVQAKLRHYRAAVLKAAVEGALTAEWRAQQSDAESASELLQGILDERRRRWEQSQIEKFKIAGSAPPKDWRTKYQQPIPPDGVDLPTLPDRWCWTTGDQLFGFVTSGSRGWAKYYADNGALFLRMGNLDHESISLDLADIQRVAPPEGAEGTRTKVEHGDILISITADVGMTGLVPSTLEKAFISQHVALARPVKGVCPAYLAWYLASASGGQKQFKALQRGATKVGLGLDDINVVRVPLAPLAEQAAIVEAVDDQLSVIEHLEADLDAKFKSAQVLRQSILRHAFTGQLVPQDSSNEPAIELMKRIALEREEHIKQAATFKQTTKKAKVAKTRRTKARPKSPRRRAPAISL